jgi:hypothetical protein
MRPFGVALGKGGEIVISDHKRREVYIFRAKGVSLVQRIAHDGDSKVSLNHPWGVAVDEEGKLFVADQHISYEGESTHGRLRMLSF